MKDLLVDHINRNAKFSESEIEKFCERFHLKNISKKELLLKQGTLCKFEGFVIEGCFRVFTLDKKGNENTLIFAAKDWWLMDIDSFMNSTPSNFNIVAVEDSKVLLINREDKLALYDSLPVAGDFF